MKKSVYVVAGLGLLLAACGRSETAKAPANGAGPSASASAPAAASVGLPKRGEFPGFYLDQINEAADPLNKPATVASGAAITMSGFGYDPVSKKPAKAVDVVIDGQPYATQYGLARPDVATAKKDPGLSPTGYKLSLPPGVIAPGRHAVTIRVIANDGTAYTESPTISFQVK